MMLVVTARWRAKKGKSREVADVLARHALQTRSEPGVVTFIAHQSKSDDHEFLIYEQFVDQAALAAHEDTPHFKRNVLEQAVPMLDVRERHYYNVLRV